MSNDAIVTERLTKAYGPRTVLRDVSLRVPHGEMFGFLGPNGAGKTTLIRILLGLLRATRGAAAVLGADAWRDGPRLRAEIGYLPGDVRFYDNLTGRQTLDFFDDARGRRHRGEADRLVERFELDVDKRVRTYSRGMKQKLGLIQALLHRPQLLILDEPTTGLDPLMREALFDELRAAVGQGRTVLFSSHTLSEVQELCDEVAIVRDGRLVEQEKISVLRGRAMRHVEVRFATQGASAPLPPGLIPTHGADGLLKATWSGDIAPLLAWLAQAGVADVSIAPPALEDLFRDYYKPSDAADGADPR